MFRVCVRIFDAERGRDRGGGGTPRFALEHDEAPGRKLAVIRHPRRDGQEGIDFGCGRGGAGELDRLERASGGEEFAGVGHSQSSPSTRPPSAQTATPLYISPLS